MQKKLQIDKKWKDYQKQIISDAKELFYKAETATYDLD